MSNLTHSNQLIELTESDLRERVPAIYATDADSRVSDRYTFVPTSDVLPVLQDSGFVVTSASTRRSGGIHARHRLELFHRDSLDDLRKGRLDGCPRVILENSHDRSRRLVLLAGYYRLVCSNGLVVASGASGELKSLHLKLDRTAICTLVKDLARMLDATTSAAESFRKRMLTPMEKSTFACYALEARYRGWNYYPIEAKSLLAVRRDADKGDDLWTVFNRVQENIVRGGMTTNAGRRSQGLKSFHASVKVNQQLWAGAEALAAGGTKALQVLRKQISKE
jgi:hypothetical protein